MVETAGAVREERKVVTVLFADLVGFTSRSEQLDPEDVRAFLSPYYARLRTELERFGGTVEKFIGDAVMALFGAPVAHEDDPERAVRAALAIRDWVLERERGLQVRIAVNTGEVLVALGARASQGEGMASGDVVNTTARLQTAAPVNGILVGEATYRATSEVISYRATEAVTAKGKALPVPAWEALEARSRFGMDLARMSRAPLAGRLREVNVLKDALKRVRGDRSTQLVTLAGVPGMGKSRLVAELFKVVESDLSELIFWRQGRSLPYGDGLTFWALGEMVKAQAGIMETDTQEQVEEKLRASVAKLIAEPTDARWIEGHLRPLAGLRTDADGGGDRRDEAFTAWRRFFEALAEQGPLVLVFEDLHWADDNLLDFLEYLVSWATGVPLLVVCTARPELFERRAGWGGGMRNSTTLWLSPLSEEETARLISSLSDRPIMDAETQQALLDRAGGNPLYAEQYVHMLEEDRGNSEDLPLPETVQGIIAARLDALPTEEKLLVQSAAVIGKVFWLGAVTVVKGANRRDAELGLHALERKDFVQRARRSSVAEEAEYSFLHVLVRDVAYGQIPRGERAQKHALAAQWITSLASTEHHAEMLAHHHMSEVALRRAAGQTIDAALAERTLASLRGAGDRAYSLNAYGIAAGYYQSGLDLAPGGSLARAQLHFKLGASKYLAGDLDPATLLAASTELGACRDNATQAEAEAMLAELSSHRGRSEQVFEHLDRARDLVGTGEPSRVTAHVTSIISRFLMLAGRPNDAIRVGRDALMMAERLGLDAVRADALVSIGASRCFSGDAGGIEDLEQADAAAAECNAPSVLCRAKTNLGATWWLRGDLERAIAFWADAEEIAVRFGQNVFRRWLRGNYAADRYVLGQWQAALAAADEVLAEVEAGSPHYWAPLCYASRAQIRLGHDDVPGALADVERAIELARLAKDPQAMDPTLAIAAFVFREVGNGKRTVEMVDEALELLLVEQAAGPQRSDVLHVLAWTAFALERGRELLAVLPTSEVPWVRAARAFATGELREAADICGSMGARTEEARDRLWLAEALIKQHRGAEADVELRRALAFYRSVGATRYIREAEALLSASA
jgi:class 3 adenylate cyclase/tetratricopeptide (TPR) repeat protein